MDVKQLIKMNNEKREKLTKDNREDYEEMVVYIRSNFNISELETEEVLMELLDHLLEAQSQGKTAKDIFGADLKAYCNELIAEIPKEPTSTKVLFVTYLVLNLIGSVGMFLAVFSFILYRFFDLGYRAWTFPLGTGIAIVVSGLILVSIWVASILLWINSSSFKTKKTKKWVEFLQLWIFSMIFLGLFIVIIKFMPSFGQEISISHLMIFIFAAIFYVISFVLNKKFRFV